VQCATSVQVKEGNGPQVKRCGVWHGKEVCVCGVRVWEPRAGVQRWCVGGVGKWENVGSRGEVVGSVRVVEVWEVWWQNKVLVCSVGARNAVCGIVAKNVWGRV